MTTVYTLFLGLDWDGVSTWVQTHLLRALVIVVAAFITIKLTRRLAPRIARGVTSLQSGEPDPDDVRRAQTVAAVVTYAIKVLVVVVASLMILSELGFDLTPLLASVGFISVFAGLAAQSIVRDYIRGFLIVGGNYYVVGDRIRIGGVTGNVDELTLRRTVVLGDDGSTNYVSHGDSDVVTRFAKGPTVTVLRAAVPRSADPTVVTRVLAETARAFAVDEAWKDAAMSIPEVGAVRPSGDSIAVVTISFRVRDEMQWAAVVELRRRAQQALEREGIPLSSDAPQPSAVPATPGDEGAASTTPAAAPSGSGTASRPGGDAVD